ncbi:MAG: NAD(P)-dependent oxidoreductase [Planctomycetota bacterium]|nr:NAD(P)-dependent oxidoreductase [Planctomycetota bacterium]
MAGVPVAFIGLGLMGRPMAFHLLKHGHAVRVFNRNPAKTAGYAEQGGVVCATPAEAARGAKIVFTCVGDGPDVQQVLFDEKTGATREASAGALFVDHSTIAPEAAQQIHARMDGRWRFVDAPISGGQKGAIDGTLAIMCGGAPADFDEAEPVMRSYGKKITLVGGPGMGQAAKACNQILVVNSIMGVAEALMLARRLGADPAKVREAILDGAARSWSLEVLGPKMIAGDDSAGFFIKHQQKDLRIVLESARAKNQPLPATALIHEIYKMLQARGGDKKGNHCLYRAVQIMGGEDWRAD